jgi:hypothetical protein
LTVLFLHRFLGPTFQGKLLRHWRRNAVPESENVKVSSLRGSLNFHH